MCHEPLTCLRLDIDSTVGSPELELVQCQTETPERELPSDGSESRKSVFNAEVTNKDRNITIGHCIEHIDVMRGSTGKYEVWPVDLQA